MNQSPIDPPPMGQLIIGGKAIDFDAPPFKKTIENDPNPPKMIPLFSDKVLSAAEEIMELILLEVEEGDQRETYDAFSEPEKMAFWLSIADGCNDSIED